MPAPEPFPTFVVYEIVLDILPAMQGLVECFVIVEILVYVHETNHGLSLYPPVKVIVLCTFVKISLMYHGAIWIQSFLRSRLDADSDEKQVKRAVDSLLRRGHHYSRIREALNSLSFDTDEFPEE